MHVEIIVEGEGLLDIEAIRIPLGANGKELIAAVAKRGGFPAGAILRMYDSMPAHIQPLARRQWRDLLEAYAPKSDANPFGKGDPPAKASGKKKRKPGTQ